MSEPALVVRRRRQVPWVVAALVALAVAALGAWYVNSPRALPTSEAVLRASAAAGQPVFVGVFTATADFDRTLDLSGVKVRTTANTRVEVVPHLCREGSLSVTTDPAAFCGELLDPAGQAFSTGDSIVLEVVSDQTAIAVIDRIRLGFREGLQWGTLEAGSRAIVTIRGR